MPLFRRQALVDNAVNARLVETVVFTDDPHAIGQALADEAAGRLQGRGGHAYAGDKGDPSQSFNGRVPSMQAFVGASTIARTSVVTRDQLGADISTGVTNEGPFADVTQRIFAQRLARRSPL